MDQGGTYRFYTFNYSNHDYGWTTVNMDLVNFGYQGIFSPFIPLWWMGEEMGKLVQNQTLYFHGNMDMSLLDIAKNRNFYETAKKMIRIRRSYPDIFNYYPINHQDSNICKVSVGGLETLQAYGRYDSKGNGIIVVPNKNIQDKTSPFTIAIPFEEMGLNGYSNYTITNLMTDKVIVSGKQSATTVFKASVDYDTVGVFLVQGKNRIPDSSQSSSSKGTNISQVSSAISSSTDISSSSEISSSSQLSNSLSASASSNKNSNNSAPKNSGINFVVIILLFIGVLIVGSAVAWFILRKRNKV